jgi:hypothetical protein
LANGHAAALGISILEAQAVGTPVVVSDSGGIAEGIERDRSGYAVPERDVSEPVFTIVTKILPRDSCAMRIAFISPPRQPDLSRPHCSAFIAGNHAGRGGNRICLKKQLIVIRE